MFYKALVAALLLPGLVAFAIPFAIGYFDKYAKTGTSYGWFPLSLGLILLLRCIRDFYASGKGTLAPWTPPVKFVRTGLYRYTRNPMYVGVMAILMGQGLMHGSWLIAAYSVIVLTAFVIHVHLVEEPWLAREFPRQWRYYSRRVPRWSIRCPLLRRSKK